MENTDTPIIFFRNNLQNIENILSSIKEILENHSIEIKTDNSYILLKIFFFFENKLK